ncbi:two-component system response regulator CreB [Oleispira antarctica]|uniref:Two-component system response regulator CreB n=1 Tax=Oleispira antarctica TaxID=188908 RepID=A0A1Y5HW06_OLEAN|nr:two-component system response regulator CreB [Oleispira antarctica]
MKPNACVLLVEDEPSIADNIKYALSSASFEVLWAASGTEALKQFNEQHIDLVILDIGLPDMDGFEVCRQIREISQVPLLFLTARSDEIDRVVGLEMGADDYICKPFSPRELVARVKANLRRSTASPLSNEILVLNDENRSVHFCGQLLQVTRYEFGILQVMHKHPKRVYSREALLEQVWHEPDNSMDRVVDTHIKTLRAKFKEVDREKDIIKTHRGVGYSLEIS